MLASTRARGARATSTSRIRESCERFVRRRDRVELGGLDILVNNAGLARAATRCGSEPEEDEREVIETNVLGLMRITRLCVPHLVDEHGHIVNIGSVAGIWSYVNGSSYVASNFAVHGYTRALRDDLQGKPVRITNVAGGLVETDFSKVRFHGDEEKAKAVYATSRWAGRCTRPTWSTASCSRSRGPRT